MAKSDCDWKPRASDDTPVFRMSVVGPGSFYFMPGGMTFYRPQGIVQHTAKPGIYVSATDPRTDEQLRTLFK